MTDVERVIGSFFTIVGVVGGILAATAEQNGSLVFGGGLAAVALAGVTLVFTSSRKDLRAVRTALRECEEKHDLMAWRFEVVLGILHHLGAPVPAELWQRKP